MKPAVMVVPGESFAAVAASTIADRIATALSRRDGCALALSGGRTPAAVFRDLVGRNIDWPDVSIYFGDERAVPPDDPDSNFRMAREAFLDLVPIRPDRIHRLDGGATDLDAAAIAYERILPDPLDIVILGIGDDGHTASLFPRSEAVGETRRRVVAVATSPVAPHVARLTITPPVIAAARDVVVLVAGAAKAAVLAAVLEGPDQPGILPAQLARRGTWIVDRDAAAQLHTGDH